MPRVPNKTDIEHKYAISLMKLWLMRTTHHGQCAVTYRARDKSGVLIEVSSQCPLMSCSKTTGYSS